MELEGFFIQLNQMQSAFLILFASFALMIGCSRPQAETETLPPAQSTAVKLPLDKPALDEPKTVFEEVARAYDDPRNDGQIQKDNAFIEAVRGGDLDAAKESLASGAGVDARYVDPYAFLSAGQNGYTALLYASIDGNVEMVKLLISHKADVNRSRDGKTPLYFAAIECHDEVVELLRKAGAEGDSEKMLLTEELIRAACKGFEMGSGEGYPPYPGVVRDLDGASEIVAVLKQGADVNATDPEGYTPLMYAANLGLIENVRILLEHGADASLATANGVTALSLVEGDASVNRNERKQIAELLTEHLTTKH